MRATVALLMILGTCACGADSPTTPTTIPPPPPARDSASTTTASDRGPSIATFTMSGQIIDGTYHYWPTITIAAGSAAIVVKSVAYVLPDVTLTNDHATLNWTIAAGGSFDFSTARTHFELMGSGPATQATVTVVYADASGQTHQLTATTPIPPIPADPSQAILQMSNFIVTRWQQTPSEWDYWPRLTPTETGGLSAATITRIDFTLLDIGIYGSVPPEFGSWTVPSGGSITVFDKRIYGDPELAISNDRSTDRVMVTVSYVDAAGRSGSLTATAQVSAEDGVDAAGR